MLPTLKMRVDMIFQAPNQSPILHESLQSLMLSHIKLKRCGRKVTWEEAGVLQAALLMLVRFLLHHKPLRIRDQWL